MIKANYLEYRDSECGLIMVLNVEGHAQAGPEGQDIVCAAVSALVQTLGDRVEALALQGGADNCSKTYDKKHNRYVVHGCFLPEQESRAKAWYEFAREGIAAIAAQYPECVELEEHILAEDKEEDKAE